MEEPARKYMEGLTDDRAAVFGRNTIGSYSQLIIMQLGLGQGDTGQWRRQGIGEGIVQVLAAEGALPVVSEEMKTTTGNWWRR